MQWTQTDGGQLRCFPKTDMALLICHMNVCQADWGRKRVWEESIFSPALFSHQCSRQLCRNQRKTHWVEELLPSTAENTKTLSSRCEPHVPLLKYTYSKANTKTSVWTWNSTIINPYLCLMPTFSCSSLLVFISKSVCAHFDIYPWAHLFTTRSQS